MFIFRSFVFKIKISWVSQITFPHLTSSPLLCVGEGDTQPWHSPMHPSNPGLRILNLCMHRNMFGVTFMKYKREGETFT